MGLTRDEYRLMKAVHDNNLQSIKTLIGSGAWVNATSDLGSTCLHVASIKGALALVSALVETFEADVEIANKDGHTALHLAAFNGRLSVVKYLLEHGASSHGMLSPPPSPPSSSDAENPPPPCGHGQSPIHLACVNGHVEVVRFLVERGAKMEATSKLGATALHYAAENGRFAVVKYLVECGANLAAADADGKTPLDKIREDRYKDHERAEIIVYLEKQARARALPRSDPPNSPSLASPVLA